MTLEPLPGDFYNFQGLLTREEQDIVARVRTFFQEKVAPIANDAWAAAEFQFDLIPGFAALDIVKLSHEGARSLLTGWISLEMSRVDPSHSTFFGVHSGLATGTIRSFGSDEMLERLLPAMMRMQKIGAFALTEPEGGSDVSAGMRTVARREGDHWVLNGAKRWIGNATFADLVIVWARDEADNKVKGFVVEKGTPGFTATKIERKMALRTVQNADIVLADCRVPEANRLQKARRIPRYRGSPAPHPRRRRLAIGGHHDGRLRERPGIREIPEAVWKADRELSAGPGSPGADAGQPHDFARAGRPVGAGPG